MAGNIHRYDCYDLRKFRPGDIDVFLDIGAQIGSTTVMAKLLNPTARIIAIEPCKESFDTLRKQVWGAECYNVALGPGTPMCFIKGKNSGLNRFVDENEKQWWPNGDNIEGGNILVESKTLEQLFVDYQIPWKQNYIIKLDCEGGERYLLQEEDAVYCVRHSTQTVLELHFGFGGTFEQWRDWLALFKDTHELLVGDWEFGVKIKRYIYKLCSELPLKGRGWRQVELVRRNWIERR
jgi:FkbM family methyltransferase